MINLFLGNRQGVSAYYRVEENLIILEGYKLLIDQSNGGSRKRREVTEGVQPKEAIIITYNSTDILVQMAIVSEGDQTFLILKYERADQVVNALYSDFGCTGGFLLSGVNATHTSNIGYPGVHVFSLSSFCNQSTSSVGKKLV